MVEGDYVDLWHGHRDMTQALIQNTIETYAPEWRLLQEPIQNSIDSFISLDGKVWPEGSPPAQVTVEIFLGANKVLVRDNGFGVPADRFPMFLLLGAGSKGERLANHEIRKLLKGSQGVGIKSTVFTSEMFEISTVCDGKKWAASFPNFAGYMDQNFEGKIPKPAPVDTEDPSGTELRIRLQDYSTLDFLTDRIDSFFEAAGVTPSEDDPTVLVADGRPLPEFDVLRILLRYFRTDTYVGDMTRILQPGALPDVDFNLVIHCDFSDEDEHAYQFTGVKRLESGKSYGITCPVGYLEFDEEIDLLPPRIKPPVLTDHKRMLESGHVADRTSVFYQVLTPGSIIELLGNLRKRRGSDPAGMDPNILEANADRVQTNRTALNKVNGGMLFIASRKFLRNPLAHKSRISLSVNGLPTDITLDIGGAELGYLPATHLVIDVDEKLGYGKRNLPSRSKGIYNRLGTDMWRTIHKLAKQIVSGVEEYDFTLKGKRHDKKRDFALQLDPSDPRNNAAMDWMGRRTWPRSEEDVVAVYFHLVGKGAIEPFGWLRVHDQTIYDGIALPSMTEVGRDELDVITIEFKPTLSDLCKSDDQRKQRFADMDVAIVWSVGKDEDLPPGYRVVHREADIEYSGYYEQATHRVKGGRYSVQVIELRQIVDDLLEAATESVSMSANSQEN